jgi:hypothetical protein
VASFKAGPLYWATTYTATENPNHEAQGRKFRSPLPKHSYFIPLFEAFLERERLFVPKTREMLTSWCAVAYAEAQAQWHKWDCIFQTASLQKASELIEYGSQLYRNQPEWLKKRHPLKKDVTTFEIEFAEGGRLMALPSGEDKIRLYHPTLYVMDEAAFLPEAQQCYDAAEPVAHQIIAISSAGPGWFGLQCST